MRTVVTGGAGFIGSNLVDALVARGDEVTVLDNLTTGRRENLEDALAKDAKLVDADLRDDEAVRDLLEQASPENSSTGGAIYGEGRVLPAPESHPQAPEAGYGQSKLAAEGYCDLYRRLHGLSTVSLRYGNVYGPRQDPLGEAGVIAIFCGKLRDGGRPTVFGDGLQTRDYVYVGDVVDANLAAAGSDAGGAFNVGLGLQTSVLELVEALSRLGNRPDFEPEHAPERPGEIRRIAIDARRAREELGWEPKVQLDEGLERTLASIEV